MFGSFDNWREFSNSGRQPGADPRSAIWKSCSPSAGWRRITRRSGVGCNMAVPNWNGYCPSSSGRPTNPGGRWIHVRVQDHICDLYQAMESTDATINFLLPALRDATFRRLFVRLSASRCIRNPAPSRPIWPVSNEL
jgi:hypothetical protein